MVNQNLLILERSAQNLQKITRDGKTMLEGVFAEFGIENRNGRIYEEKEYLPDFSLTVIMEADSEKKEGEWLYYEQDGFEITLANYRNGKMAMEAVSELSCFICIPDDEPETE